MKDNSKIQYKVFDVTGKQGFFTVKKQTTKLSEKDLRANAVVPVYSSQNSNNGIMGFTNREPDFLIEEKPALVFGDHTRCMDIVEYSFCAADNVKILMPKCNNKYELIYIASSWKKRIPDMGYSRHWRKAKKVGIELPVDNQGNPDYVFMAEYSKEKQKELLSRYKSFIQSIIAGIDYQEVPSAHNKKWKDVSLDDLFVVKPGKRLETRNKAPGNRPFIGATDNGNGITGFVGNENTSKDNNVLGVNYNGAPCIAFYHPYDCIFSDDVKRLHLKEHADNKFIYLFFVAIFSQQKSKYSYGYKFKEQRMLRQKLMVPVKDNGKADYEYMEQYAKNMMLKKYKQYLSFLERKEQKQ